MTKKAGRPESPAPENGAAAAQNEQSATLVAGSHDHQPEVKDAASPASKPIVEYTWGKIWNAKAYNACSNMPRSGHMGNLSETQIKHIMALLLDPASPVNK